MNDLENEYQIFVGNDIAFERYGAPTKGRPGRGMVPFVVVQHSTDKRLVEVEVSGNEFRNAIRRAKAENYLWRLRALMSHATR